MADGLLTISGFARRVGLTPSALRFYDDCDLLRPAVVDEGNGYRYYDPAQEPRARLLRDLREIDLPLAAVRQVLDAGPAEAAAVVRAHLRTVESKAETARRAAGRILGVLESQRSGVVLGGPELASAIRQVTPAAAVGGEFPALECVQVELTEDEVTLVATDRYRLAVRKLQPRSFTGSPGRLLVRAGELAGLARWVAAAPEVRVETSGAAQAEVGGGEARPVAGVRLEVGDGEAWAVDGDVAGEVVRVSREGDGEVRELALVGAEYPAYQAILDGLMPPVCRVVVDRPRLLELLGDGLVALSIEAGKVVVEGRGELEAVGSGEALRVGFTAPLLAAALDSSVGPDVLLEIGAPDRPVVVRSADQGTFTTLVMPARLDG